jgi:hypothetical protein
MTQDMAQSVYKDFLYIARRINDIAIQICLLMALEAKKIRYSMFFCLYTIAQAIQNSTHPLVRQHFPELFSDPSIRAMDIKGWLGLQKMLKTTFEDSYINGVAWNTIKKDVPILHEQVNVAIAYFAKRIQI